METPSHFSFGVNEKKSKESDKFVGYSIPVCLREKESDPTPEETGAPNGNFRENICSQDD